MEVCVDRKFFKITGTEQILGSAPGDPEIYSKFIASKAPDPAATDGELDTLPDIRDKMTGFRRNNHGELCLPAYVVKGYFKGAVDTLKGQIGIRGGKG